ncbi:MAG: hypothetical protein IT247_02350 [Bacteroidia bacterium]|nr:hypothetical protein [Bacteroidia bacterium]
MNKIKPAHFITLLVLGVFGYMAYYLGFFCRYNYITAMIDQDKGRIRIIEFGNPPADTGRDSLAKAFGFTFEKTGKIPSIGENNGINIYNKTMISYLKQTHGMEWWHKVKHQFRDLKKDE